MSESRTPQEPSSHLEGVPGAVPDPAAGEATGGRASGHPRRSRAGQVAAVAVVVSVIALVVAGASTVVAWRALDQARDAKDVALGRGASRSSPTGTPGPDGGTGSTSAAPPGTSSTPSEDVPRSPGVPPELNARTVYEPKYDKQTLVLNAGCSDSMYVDLDEPRANVSEYGYDIRFSRGCTNDPSAFTMGDGVAATVMDRPGVTPQDCGERIRTAPVPADFRIPVRKGMSFCVTTDYSAAYKRGDRWRLVLVEVLAEGNDGSTTVQATAWNIPG